MNRLHIIILGACNSGKSSVVNMLTGQQTALVANLPGTTTDPVKKNMELPHLGAVTFIDTAGFDDATPLADARIKLTEKALTEADIAILLTGENIEEEQVWREKLRKRKIPVIEVANKSDIRPACAPGILAVSTLVNPEKSRKELIGAILRAVPENFGSDNLIRGLASAGDTVMLVMPQDVSAPKGRLILPQVQTLRALLDIGATAVCTTPQQLEATLSSLAKAPQLIITDSQVFAKVHPLVPENTLLTSFSVLMAAYKGDIAYFVKSAQTISQLTPESKVLIAEACTHVPQSEDIGTVKIPAMLRKKISPELHIDFVRGSDFPTNLTDYNLIIHCGACMFNRSYVLSRVEAARAAGVPMTNYGIAIAFLTGILSKVAY